ncbi:MAG: right-handed parallel beta-helix repeat-containing protein [Fimbriimonadaceae bacterium]|nr:right-handed parallel beta-helix repeat-containing protein [Chthonomonadaceae bacterium]MCO5297220.1 right-handed parallel beta-helix repeat-containing protein [Fimbriimonadaceae bacterium]
MVWCALALAAPASGMVVIFAAPSARGGNGSREAPYSLPEAQAAARKVKGRRTVRLMGGVYWLERTWKVTPEDSGTTFEAVPGESPILDGGQQLVNWNPEPGELWETQPAGTRVRQLFVDGKRAERARWPEPGHLVQFKSVSERVLEKGDGRKPQRTELRIDLGPEGMAVLQRMPAEDLALVDLVAYHKWDTTRRSNLRIEDGVLVSVGEGMKPWNVLDTSTDYVLENVPAGLGRPGTYVERANGQVLYRPLPGQTKTQATPVAGRLDRLLQIQGEPGSPVRDVSFVGLAFRYARFAIPEEGLEPAQAASNLGAAIEADYAWDVTLRGVRVENVGEYAVWFREGCLRGRVLDSVMQDLGAGGVRIGTASEPSGAQAVTRECVVENSIIRSGGHTAPCAVGVWIGHASDNVVRFCDIGDLGYSGVSIGWRWGYNPSFAKRNVIRNCHIHDLGHGLLSDMAGVYTLGPSEGTVVANCWIHDVQSRHYGGWGLYTDEGSTGIVMENCLVHDTTSGGFHQHYGKENVVRNCLFAFARDQQLQATRVEDHLSFTLDRCLVVWDRGQPLAGPWSQVRLQAKDVLWEPLEGAGRSWAGMTFDQWSALPGVSGNRLVQGLFVDAKARDFRLAPNSPAKAIGFVPLDLRKVGVRPRRDPLPDTSDPNRRSP